MQHRQGNRYFVVVLAPWFILYRCREQGLKTERTVTKFRVLFHLLPVPETSILVFVLSTHFPHTSLGRRMTWTGKVFSFLFFKAGFPETEKKSPSSSASSKASRHIVRLGCDLVVTGSGGGLGAQSSSCIKPLLTLFWSNHSFLIAITSASSPRWGWPARSWASCRGPRSCRCGWAWPCGGRCRARSRSEGPRGRSGRQGDGIIV